MLGDEDYVNLLNATSMNGIILLDDISVDLLRENGYLEKTEEYKVAIPEPPQPKQLLPEKPVDPGVEQKLEAAPPEPRYKTQIRRVRVTYSMLLNILDGVNAVNGRLTFLCTNHVDQIGKALKRAGRIDIKAELGFAKNSEIVDYFKLFYKFFDVPEDEIIKKANEFVTRARNSPSGSKITFADIQQFLVLYLKDIDAVVENAHKIKALDELF